MSKYRQDGKTSEAKNVSALSREVEKTNAIHVFHRCGGCGKKQEFLNMN